MKFITWDQDNDILFIGNCVYYKKFGWWYWDCICVNVNGLYLVGEIILNNEGVMYGYWWGWYYLMKLMQFMVR